MLCMEYGQTIGKTLWCAVFHIDLCSNQNTLPLKPSPYRLRTLYPLRPTNRPNSSTARLFGYPDVCRKNAVEHLKEANCFRRFFCPSPAPPPRNRQEKLAAHIWFRFNIQYPIAFAAHKSISGTHPPVLLACTFLFFFLFGLPFVDCWLHNSQLF